MNKYYCSSINQLFKSEIALIIIIGHLIANNSVQQWLIFHN